MMAMLRLSYVPGSVEWVYRQGDAKTKLAISDQSSPSVFVYDAKSGSNEPISTKQVAESSKRVKGKISDCLPCMTAERSFVLVGDSNCII